jgi:hypothetical protein
LARTRRLIGVDVVALKDEVVRFLVLAFLKQKLISDPVFLKRQGEEIGS